MVHERFDEIMDEIFYECKELCALKNNEYARGDDKLHNFKKAARFAEGNCQVGALKGMLLKHTVSVYDMMDDHIAGSPHDLAKWREKIHDHIIYLVLLYAMVEEEDLACLTDNIRSYTYSRTYPVTDRGVEMAENTLTELKE